MDSLTPTFVGKVDTFYATIHMAGDIDHARQIIRIFVLEGACVQLQPCEYIYTGGLESGFTARILSYARFPKSDGDILNQAFRLAETLCRRLGQVSFSIETPHKCAYYETSLKK